MFLKPPVFDQRRFLKTTLVHTQRIGALGPALATFMYFAEKVWFEPSFTNALHRG